MTHSTISGESGSDPTSCDPHAPLKSAPPSRTLGSLKTDLGHELRSAREARGLDIETCGHTLRLPIRVLKQLEAGDYSGIDHGVYLRNYLQSYAACVGVPETTVKAAIEQLAPAERKPELVSTGGVSRSRYLWHRYTTAATYTILTAVIVVPLIWLGVKGGLDRELTHLEPLNSAPVAQHEVAVAKSGLGGDASASSQSGGNLSAHGQGTNDEQPLMASMAPFSALDKVDSQPQPVTAPVISTPGSHTLSITLTQPSWVEVTTASGKRLEYSLLPAGTHKAWHSTQPLRVSIGDTSGASVDLDGKPVDLGAYKHANVAHFRVALKNGKASTQAM